jgi:hypothetical protein
MAMPAAHAAPPPSTPDASRAIAMLQLTAAQLNQQDLSTIRGGFDISPKLSISFSFQQVDYAGAKIIQSILVPTTILTQNSTPAPVTVSSTGQTAIPPYRRQRGRHVGHQ